jgi:hypothetical protein
MSAARSTLRPTGGGGAPSDRRPPGRGRRRRGPTLVVLGVAALLAFGAGLVAGAGREDAERDAARRFVAAWERLDYQAMYQQLTPGAQRRTSLRRFARAYRDAGVTLTLLRVRAGPVEEPREGEVEVPVTITTRRFGRIGGTLQLPTGADAEAPGIDWRRHLVFPALQPGEKLTRRSQLPPRAAILARDGTPLAQGPERSSPLGTLASDLSGTVGPAPAERAADLRRQGLDTDTPVGLTGLERELDAKLAGQSATRLLAGRRVIATAAAVPAEPVTTTIDVDLQRAAVTALGGRYGGIAVLVPATGEVRALAGIAASAPQPPGSVFKIVTLAGALQAGTVRRSERFPVETSTTLEGVRLENAHGESCGGTLRESFAHSCNSVFAPMGAELGAAKLVAAAERFGFNEPAPFAFAGASTIPPAAEIGDDLAVGSTAIGQGRVLATALQMASVAATIGERGRRMRPVLVRGERKPAPRAATASVARYVRGAMRAVVTSGTGTGARIEGVSVAGKTGTAELRTTVRSEPPDAADPTAVAPAEDPTDTDAWFAAFAPAGDPRLAVAVLLVAQGAGGETAAPIAREVLVAGLRGK